MKKLLLGAILLFAVPAIAQVGAYVPDDENTHTNQAIIEHRPIPKSQNSAGYIIRGDDYQSDSPNPQKEYEQGWISGYKAGWCYGQGYGCIEPIVPICPIPRIGESGFKDGYNRGFLNGIAARKNSE